MHERVLVRPGAYHDSVTLMLASQRASQAEGAETVAVAMGTPLNLELIREQGFAVEGDPGPNDLVVAVRVRDAAAVDGVVAAVDAALAERSAGDDASAAEAPPRSLVAAVRRQPGLSVACLSIPGRHVAYEAAAALEGGLHVFCFSDGVSLEHEAVLKRRALERGLLFLGADCGTAIVDGVALGFANAVGRGPVGIVGASGTGIQEVCCLLDAAGIGISHAIGLGGRDLRAEIGGAMCRRGLELLARDDGTEAIVVISKPPDPEVAAEVARAAARAPQPVVLAFLGLEAPPAAPEGVEYARTLQDAAARAAELAGGRLPEFAERLSRPPARGAVRGLYSGGTLCEEARGIVGGEGHAFIDFGADELTEGRPHPMIDPSLRLERLRREAADPAVTVLLLDVVLGYGAHPDPAAELAPVLEEALGARSDLHAIVALCGADGDPQGLESQRERLAAGGAVVTRSNAHAARLAREACGG